MPLRGDYGSARWLRANNARHPTDRSRDSGLERARVHLAGSTNNPFGLAFDTLGNLYVSNRNANTIETFDSSGNLYVANFDSNSVSKFDSAGNFVLSWSTTGPMFLAIRPVPEPSSDAVALAGLVGGGSWMWRRRKRALTLHGDARTPRQPA